MKAKKRHGHEKGRERRQRMGRGKGGGKVEKSEGQEWPVSLRIQRVPSSTSG